MPEQFYFPATYRAKDSVGYLIRRLYSILGGRIDGHLAVRGLTLMQWIVLIYVRDGLAHTASDIAREFQHDSGALTRVIDQLEERGYLRRERSQQDRRFVELKLTSEGRQIIDLLLPRVLEELNWALEPLDRVEFEQFCGFLSRIIAHLQATEAVEAKERAMPDVTR
jgi:DNA-binding MarR family transcriptional regulator